MDTHQQTGVVVPHTLLTAPTAQEAITSAIHIAAILRDTIHRCGWMCEIDGRHYVTVEGWQTLASLLSCTPYIVDVRREERDDGYVYIARCEVRRISDGHPVASGEGMCASSERLRRRDGTSIVRWTDEYQVRSMAQTRSVSRAIRNAFGGIVGLAGYETTPAEEMVMTRTTESVSYTPPPPPPAQKNKSDRWERIKYIYTLASKCGLDTRTRQVRLKWTSEIVGRQVGSYYDLTDDEISDLITALERRLSESTAPQHVQPTETTRAIVAPQTPQQPSSTPHQSLDPRVSETLRKLKNEIGWSYACRLLDEKCVDAERFALWLASHYAGQETAPLIMSIVDDIDDWVTKYQRSQEG